MALSLKDKMETLESKKTRKLPTGRTPLYYSVIKAIESQTRWVKEDPEIRLSTIIVYSDGVDNVNADSGKGFGKDAWATKKNPLKLEDLVESIKELKKTDDDSNVVRVLMGKKGDDKQET